MISLTVPNQVPHLFLVVVLVALLRLIQVISAIFLYQFNVQSNQPGHFCTNAIVNVKLQVTLTVTRKPVMILSQSILLHRLSVQANNQLFYLCTNENVMVNVKHEVMVHMTFAYVLLLLLLIVPM